MGRYRSCYFKTLFVVQDAGEFHGPGRISDRNKAVPGALQVRERGDQRSLEGAGGGVEQRPGHHGDHGHLDEADGISSHQCKACQL